MPAATTDRIEVALTGGGKNEKDTAEAVPMIIFCLNCLRFLPITSLYKPSED